MDVDFMREDQHIRGQRRDVTWISRMESVQAAVDTQLAQLAHTEPTKRVCLVTFSDDVSGITDDSSDNFNSVFIINCTYYVANLV